MEPNETKKREGGACAASSQTTADGKWSAPSEPEPAEVGEWLSNLFQGINLEQLLDEPTWLSGLPGQYLCIAPEERAMVFGYFRKFDEETEEDALFHVRHCHHCREAVAAKLHLGGDDADQENCLHGRTGDGVDSGVNDEGTEKAQGTEKARGCHAGSGGD